MDSGPSVIDLMVVFFKMKVNHSSVHISFHDENRILQGASVSIIVELETPLESVFVLGMHPCRLLLFEVLLPTESSRNNENALREHMEERESTVGLGIVDRSDS